MQAPEPKKRVVGPAAGEFEPVPFPGVPSPPPTSASAPPPQPSTSSPRPAKVISRPDLPTGLRPGTTTGASRLSASEAASSLSINTLSVSRSDSRQQLRHSISGDGLSSEFHQNAQDPAERNRRASYFGPPSNVADRFPVRTLLAPLREALLCGDLTRMLDSPYVILLTQMLI